MATTFTYDERDYELKMTRAGVAAAEGAGLRASDIAETPFSSLNLLFFAALHPYRVPPAKAASMLETLLDEGTVKFTELFEELAEAYAKLFE